MSEDHEDAIARYGLEYIGRSRRAQLLQVASKRAALFIREGAPHAQLGLYTSYRIEIPELLRWVALRLVEGDKIVQEDKTQLYQASAAVKRVAHEYDANGDALEVYAGALTFRAR